MNWTQNQDTFRKVHALNWSISQLNVEEQGIIEGRLWQDTKEFSLQHCRENREILMSMVREIVG